jgi:uncharacterized heparinase superfamily protein
MGRAALYWHTVRHLRARQIFNRISRRLRKPKVVIARAPRQRAAPGRWVMPARRQPSMTGPFSFRFLEDARRIAPVEWNPAGASRLWSYNLHYFDDLTAVDAGSRTPWHAAAMDDWIASNAIGTVPGWEPYPTSLRIVSWIKWAHAGHALPRLACDSLAAQAEWLAQSVEWHLGGNHLFSNAKALVFAGVFFEGPRAARWLSQGIEIIEEELPGQVLPDGGHFERSPMYHALALEDVLDLLNLSRMYGGPLDSLEPRLREAAPRMRRFLEAMCHPDGEIAFFNDAAIGVAPAPAELARYAHDLGIDAALARGSRLFDATGYARLEARDCVLIADVAPVGPDELPGHAHADTLSFELSLFGERVIVNGGTSQYGESEGRDRERGTRAHSTVEIGAENSSEVWAGFRVARRARPFDVSLEVTPGNTVLSGAHDGYRRLRGSPVHRRSWTLVDGSLRVEDRVEGGFERAVARFHLKPGVECAVDPSATSGLLRLASGREVRWSSDGATVTIEPSTYAPRFGQRLATRCLALEIPRTGEAALRLMW